jgi:cytochrome c oxidase cbb3-type subunit 2
MNSGPLLFLGIFATLASSFWGLLLLPQLQIGRQDPVKLEATDALYPANRPGQARQGAEVYRSLGCVECHSQQVRPKWFGSDFERGWGERRTVAQDYLYDQPVLLGSLRLGPDLANIGARQTNAIWHLTHLYQPKSTSPGSMMPPYAFLFEKRKLRWGEARSLDALALTDAPNGEEIVPRPEAEALAAYLLSLHADVPLFEAPMPLTKTNAVGAAMTNTPATTTNSLPPPK